MHLIGSHNVDVDLCLVDPSIFTYKGSSGPEVIKKIMLNSAEHEILIAHKHKNIKKFSIFSGSDKPRMLFFLLINVGILTYLSRKNFMLNWVEHFFFI